MPSPVSTTATVSRAITLSLPAGVVTQVKQRARVDGISQAEVVMDAVAATVDRLGDLLARDVPVVSDGLFVRRAAPRGRDEPLSTLPLRMLSPNVDAIDELVSMHQAPSRSALCLAALRVYLGQE